MLVFPSMPKGEIVGQLVFSDVNPWGVILEIDVNPWRCPVEISGIPIGGVKEPEFD